MRYVELDVFGVYVAPITWMMVATCAVFVLIRLVSRRFGVSRWVWHPALFWLSVYVTLLSSVVLLVAR